MDNSILDCGRSFKTLVVLDDWAGIHQRSLAEALGAQFNVIVAKSDEELLHSATPGPCIVVVPMLWADPSRRLAELRSLPAVTKVIVSTSNPLMQPFDLKDFGADYVVRRDNPVATQELVRWLSEMDRYESGASSGLKG